MSSDPDEVTAVLDVLLPLLNASTALVAGAPNELGMRGPGRRVVFEVLPAPATPVTVEQDGPPVRTPRGRLPKGL
ncbi:MAG: hypothetical protein HOY79_34140 [Streptomyces sp.]|nr:hypothetical protein [Streptomyces sp.]NUS11401.1 hypothetical protein [Streptomyces sp.]NUS23458.1 hypothetical protein [Streptomyces sp.]